MVWAGTPSSHRNRLGVANQTWPVATNGCVSVRSVRVCVKSALQVRRLVCAANHALRTALVSAAPEQQMKIGKRKTPNIEHRTLNIEAAGERDFVRCSMFDVGCSVFVFTLARWERSDTIG